MPRVRALALMVLVGAATLRVDAQRPSESWRLVEVWRSGGSASGAPAFDEVIDMRLAPNGHLLVLVGGDAPALVSIDNTGRPVRSIGGSDPPPLLEEPNGFVQFADGRIVINDPRAGRFSVVSEGGRFLREVDYQPWGYTRRWLGFVAPDAALFEPVTEGGRLVWRRWAPDFTSSRLVPASGCDPGLTAAGPDATFTILGSTGQVTVPVPLRQPDLAFMRGPDGVSWAGIAPDYREIVRTPWLSCDDDVRITLGGDPHPVPDAVRLAAQQQVRQLASSLGASPPDVDRIPTTFPLFHALRIDAQHRLWVERQTTATARGFTVYTPDGRLRARVASAPVTIDAQHPWAFSDNHFFCFTTDDSGWTWLVALRIEQA